MDNETKARFYNFLLAEHTKLANQIQQIRAESVNLDSNQESRIRDLENRQNTIMQEVQKLLM